MHRLLPRFARTRVSIEDFSLVYFRNTCARSGLARVQTDSDFFGAYLGFGGVSGPQPRDPHRT